MSEANPAGAVKIQAMPTNQSGQDFSLGAITGANFQPQYILYYKLKVIRNGSDNPNDWTFEYPDSGLYNSVDIAQFVELARADDLPTLASTSDDPLLPPSVTVTDPCYVVVQLTSTDATFRFQDGHEAIKTAEDHATQYRRLAHVDGDGNIHFGTATTNCRLVYFAVKNVARSDEDHAYNIYVQYVNGTAVLKVIDPAIKNRGGDDDARAALRKEPDDVVKRRRERLKQKKQPQPVAVLSQAA